MQSLSPEKVAEILTARPHVTEADIREHERLMAEHFLENPHQPKAAEDHARISDRERRLRELHELIFAPAPRDN